jgi:hypothetical protein
LDRALTGGSRSAAYAVGKVAAAAPKAVVLFRIDRGLAAHRVWATGTVRADRIAGSGVCGYAVYFDA